MKIYHKGKIGEFVESPAIKQNDVMTPIDVETRVISHAVGDVLEYVPSEKEEYYNRLKRIIMKIIPSKTIQYDTQTQEYNRTDGFYQVPLYLLFWSDIGSSNRREDGFASIVFYARKCDEDGNLIEDECRSPYEHIENITLLSNKLFKKYPNLNEYCMEKIIKEFITQVAPVFLEQIAQHHHGNMPWSITDDILIKIADNEMQKNSQTQSSIGLLY